MVKIFENKYINLQIDESKLDQKYFWDFLSSIEYKTDEVKCFEDIEEVLLEDLDDIVDGIIPIFTFKIIYLYYTLANTNKIKWDANMIYCIENELTIEDDIKRMRCVIFEYYYEVVSEYL